MFIEDKNLTVYRIVKGWPWIYPIWNVITRTSFYNPSDLPSLRYVIICDDVTGTWPVQVKTTMECNICQTCWWIYRFKSKHGHTNKYKLNILWNNFLLAWNPKDRTKVCTRQHSLKKLLRAINLWVFVSSYNQPEVKVGLVHRRIIRFIIQKLWRDDFIIFELCVNRQNCKSIRFDRESWKGVFK